MMKDINIWHLSKVTGLPTGMYQTVLKKLNAGKV